MYLKIRPDNNRFRRPCRSVMPLSHRLGTYTNRKSDRHLKRLPNYYRVAPEVLVFLFRRAVTSQYRSGSNVFTHSAELVFYHSSRRYTYATHECSKHNTRHNMAAPLKKRLPSRALLMSSTPRTGPALDYGWSVCSQVTRTDLDSLPDHSTTSTLVVAIVIGLFLFSRCHSTNKTVSRSVDKNNYYTPLFILAHIFPTDNHVRRSWPLTTDKKKIVFIRDERKMFNRFCIN